jgi:hypothetical protein
LTPTASPRLRRSPSTWPPTDTGTGSGVGRHQATDTNHALHTGPYLSGLNPRTRLQGFHQRFFSYTFSSLLAGPGPSDSADPFRTLSELLPPSRAFPRPGCPQLHRPAATDQPRSPYHLRSIPQHLVAHAVALVQRRRGGIHPFIVIHLKLTPAHSDQLDASALCGMRPAVDGAALGTRTTSEDHAGRDAPSTASSDRKLTVISQQAATAGG